MALPVGVSRTTGAVLLLVFFVLLVGLPLLAAAVPNQSLRLVDSFYRAGSLVFGGGHVVLPLLQAEVVPPGWVTNDAFLAGYGAAQAVPGPLFTFAAYLGAAMGPAPNGWLGASICLAAIFLPSFLLATRRPAVLGRAEEQADRAGRPQGRQCRRGWSAAGGALSPGLDCRHYQPRRLLARRLGVSAPLHLAGPALDRRYPQRRRRRGPRRTAAPVSDHSATIEWTSAHSRFQLPFTGTFLPLVLERRARVRTQAVMLFAGTRRPRRRYFFEAAAIRGHSSICTRAMTL